MLQELLVDNHFLVKNKENFEGIKEIREEGIQRFESEGFPTVKEEEWKYTNIKPLLQEQYQLEVPEDQDALDYKDVKKYFLHEVESYKIVFVNGVFSSFLSQTTHDEGDICILSSALNKDKYFSVLENYLGKATSKDQKMVSLNDAYLKEGAYIHIPDNTILSRPIQIINFSTQKIKPAIYQIRNLVIVGRNAQVRIVERHQSIHDLPNFSNVVNEIFLEENAQLDWYKIQNDLTQPSLVDHTFIQQEKNSVASVHTFSFGSKITRNNLTFHQNGENCNSILKGVSLIADKQLVDNHTLVHHHEPNCESHELYRGILDEGAKGVFNGKIKVDKEAQKLSAFQQNNNILLSNNASIDTKPQLEIFADDVRCSHGCTVGELDEDALFYLQSRGIPTKEAQALMLYAFANDVTESIAIPELQNRIHKLIANKLNVNLDF